MQWAPHTFTLTTWAGIVVEVELPAMLSPFPADHDIVAEMMSAAATKLGVHRDEIYLAEGKVVLYHPCVDVTVALGTPQANEDGGTGGGISSSSSGIAEASVSVAATAPAEMKLPTELGPTAQETALATVRHARDRIAAAVGIAPARRVCRSALRGGAPGPARRRMWPVLRRSGAAGPSTARNAPDPADQAPKPVNSRILPACVKPHFRAKYVRSLFHPVSVFSHTILYTSGNPRRVAPRSSPLRAAGISSIWTPRWRPPASSTAPRWWSAVTTHPAEGCWHDQEA